MSCPDATALVAGGASGTGAAARSRCSSTGAVYDIGCGRAPY
jgi:hypothetical protein